eukprot:945190-Karenia_brevis.AAC.1
MVRFLPDEGVLSAEDAARLKQCGLLSLKVYFQTDDGQSLVAAAKLLDWNATPNPHSDEVADALSILFTQVPVLALACKKMYLWTSKMSAFAASVLDIHILLQKRDQWASELREQQDLHSAPLRAFMRNPWSDETLLNAIVAGYIVDVRDERSLFDRQDDEAEAGDFVDEAFDEAEHEEDLLSGMLSFGREGREVFGGGGARRSSASASSSQGAARGVTSLFGGAPRRGSSNQAPLFGAAAKLPNSGKKLATDASRSKKEASFDDWPLQELFDFETEAQYQIQPRDIAKLETEKLISMINKVPIPIRSMCNLPTDDKDMKVLAANVDKAAAHIHDMVVNTRLAWIQHADRFPSQKHNWGIEEDWEEIGLIQKLAAHSTFLTNKQEVEALISDLDAADDEHKKESYEILAKAQSAALREQILKYQSAVDLFKAAEDFASMHSTGPEPSLPEVRAFLNIIDKEDLRAALGMAPKEKYSKKIKPSCWRADVGKGMTLAYLGLTAHHEES